MTMRIFEPLTIRGMTLKNRIVFPPMNVRVGLRNPRGTGYYVERALGGAAAVVPHGITPDTFLDDEAWASSVDSGVGHEGWKQPSYAAKFCKDINRLSAAIHQAGAKAGCQLIYFNQFPAGIGGPRMKGDWIAPSARKETGEYSERGETTAEQSAFLRAAQQHACTPPGIWLRELTVEEIKAIVGKFGMAAAKVKAARIQLCRRVRLPWPPGAPILLAD